MIYNSIRDDKAHVEVEQFEMLSGPKGATLKILLLLWQQGVGKIICDVMVWLGIYSLQASV